MSKEQNQNQKKWDKTIKPGYKFSALWFQSSLERLLADISIKLNTLLEAEVSIGLVYNLNCTLK